MSNLSDINRFKAEDMAGEIGVFDSDLKYPSMPNNNDMTEVLKRVTSGTYAKTATVQEMLNDLLMIEGYAVFLQDNENKQRRIINWCQDNLEYLVGQEGESIPDYIGNYMPNRLTWIKANHATGQQLDKQRIVAQVKLDTIAKIHFGLQRIADAVKTCIHMRKQRYESFTE